MNLDALIAILEEVGAAARKLKADLDVEAQVQLAAFKTAAKEKLLDAVLELTHEK